MRKSEGGANLTTRNQPVRLSIAKALIELMDMKRLEDITIIELVKKANVSRMTFYKYYTSKTEVLSDYMYEIVNEYIEDTKKHPEIGYVHDEKRICHCLKFFKDYSQFIMTLVKSNMYSVVINALNDYMETYIAPTSQYSTYQLYFYAGALCNVFIQWVESGMTEEPEKIARMMMRRWR
ncbi:MAG: TetR/AcrR family transcriptional regulator [Cellulosilyticaceae bacterium]